MATYPGFHIQTARKAPQRQREVATNLLRRQAMARLREFNEKGVTAAAIARMEYEGAVIRLSRGLYQLPGATTRIHHALAEVS